ncbi:MAG TPA: zf-HC2 domain-containing protein [Blastocatellia bacterium]|nr:zf-HC2 domain-containing protein [Blastocatellia bacterium]HMV84166.1 zf-HC2 domain-containing protein [Blastocatellia bacterium]HMX25402.1 zf-HC2 domain-containing protein [Blastocatellia bacterium]HMY71790.1 zf-HC2 domain-containing protein [Blastocatellia bacterium]HMZ19093.1 zf-HC2 domain-containing protein [Blastocatellia bacterium]
MECRAVIESLSDYLDGQQRHEMPENEKCLIEEHLVVCPKCQTLKLELTEIKIAARELPLHTPPRALWLNIANTLEAELPASERKTREEFPKETWWERLTAWKFTLNFTQLAGAGALTVALIAAGIYGLSNRKPNQTDFNLNGVQTALLPGENEIKAELDHQLAEINVRKAGWEPKVRADFEQQLAKIESALETCRTQLSGNPADRTQQQALRGLYDEKRRLLENVARQK